MRKYLSYILFAGVVLLVAGIAVNHSRATRQLVDSMTGGTPPERVAAAKELLRQEAFGDSISGELPEVRVKTAETLEIMGDKTAIQKLRDLSKDQFKPVRDRATLALARIGDATPDNLTELLAGLKDGDNYIRKSTITALTDPTIGIGPKPGVCEAIAAYMQKEGGARGPGGDVLSSPKFAEGGANKAAVAPLIAQMDDKDEGVRSGAADALGKIGDPAAVPKLIELKTKDAPQVQRVAIGSLALIAAPSCEAALTEAITNPATNNEARAQAASGLGKIASASAVAVLVKTLSDDDLKIRSAAVTALSRAGRPAANGPVNPNVLTALANALRGSEKDAQIGAAQALQSIAAAQANPGLFSMLLYPQGNYLKYASYLPPTAPAPLRIAAAKALGFTGNKAAVGPLISALQDPDGTVNLAARDSLAAIGPDASDALLAATKQGGPIALYAAQALAQQGTVALPALEKATESADPNTQRWAAVALGELGVAEARPALQKLAASSNADVAFVANEQLNRIGK